MRRLKDTSVNQLPNIEPLQVKDDVVPPCATCDRCYTYLGRYVCYSDELMYDPVKGVERPIELPCAVARDTSFCEFTQRQLVALYKKKEPFDRFVNVATLVGTFIAFASCVLVFVFMLIVLAGSSNEEAEYALTVLMSIVIIIIMIASFALFLALLRRGIETGFHSKDVAWMKQCLIKGGNLKQN